MGGSISQVFLYALAGCIAGVAIAWSIQASITKRRIAQLSNEAKAKLRDATAQTDELANKYAKSKATVRQLRAANNKRSSELGAAANKLKLLAKNVRTLKTERENTKIKVSTIQNAFDSLRQQTTALQSEFGKTREFYKRELIKSLQKRKDLEEEVKKARAEQESFANAVESSVLEHGSTKNMVVAAQLRLGQLEVLERNVNKLEAENAQLRQDAKQLRLDFAAQERNLAELAELKMHNRQLVRCVETLENSRKEHESEAERYREQAGQSEKLSDTLRLKLDDLEKNFANMEEQQNEALKDVRKAAVVPILRKKG